jgi:hypothetical protein
MIDRTACYRIGRALLLLSLAVPAFAQTPPAKAATTSGDQSLAQQAADPTAPLMALSLQETYTPTLLWLARFRHRLSLPAGDSFPRLESAEPAPRHRGLHDQRTGARSALCQPAIQRLQRKGHTALDDQFRIHDSRAW